MFGVFATALRLVEAIFGFHLRLFVGGEGLGHFARLQLNGELVRFGLSGFLNQGVPTDRDPEVWRFFLSIIYNYQ